MKIAIASSGKTLGSLVDARFGRCPYYWFFDDEIGKSEVMENTAGRSFRGAGVSAAQMVVNKGVEAVMAGNFGPKAVSVLLSSGVKIFTVPAGRQSGVSGMTIKEAFERYKAGRLKEEVGLATTFGRGFGRCEGGKRK